MKTSAFFVTGLLVLSGLLVFLPIQPVHAEALSSWSNTTALRQGIAMAGGLSPICVLNSGYIYCVSGQNATSMYATEAAGVLGSWSITTRLPNGGIRSYPTDLGCFAFDGFVNCLYSDYTGGHTNYAYYASLGASGIGAWTSTNVFAFAGDYACAQSGQYVVCDTEIGYTGGTQSVVYSTLGPSGGFSAWTSTTGLVTATGSSALFATSSGSSSFINIFQNGGGIFTAKVTSGAVGSWSGNTAYAIGTAHTFCFGAQAYAYCFGGDIGGTVNAGVYYAKVGSSGTLGAWTSTSSLLTAANFLTCTIDAAFYIDCIGGQTSGSFLKVTEYASASLGAFTCSITNADAGNYLLPSGKFYDFRCSVDSNSFSGSKAAITDVRIRFNDSVATVGAEYANGTSGQFVQNNGSSIATLSNSGAVTSTISGAGDRLIVVNFLVSFSTNVADSSNRGIYLYAENADNVTVGYTYLGNSFNFLNKGGAVSVLSSGDCSIPAGADTFQTECHYGSNAHNWIAENATYYDLQDYQSQFAMQMGYPNNSTLLPSIWEPYNEGGSGANPTSNKGDWTLAMGLDYFDNTTWVKGISFKLEMLTGRVGSTNLWTAFEVLWYDGSSLVANNTVYAFVPSDGKGPSQVNIWVNLWFSQNNESTVQGGEIGAYYTGMHSSNYLLWSSWSPFLGNESQTQTFTPLLDHSGDLMSSQSAQFAKVFYNMSRPGVPEVNSYQPNFQIETLGFTEQEFGTASAGMTGVTTPSFTVAIVPTISSSSIFSPIINAIKSIATYFGKALEAIGALVWASLGQQFPWFTSAVGNFTSLLLSLVLLMGTLIADFIAIVKIIYADIGLVLVPFEIIGNAYGFIKSSFGTLLGGVNSGALIEVVVIFFFCSWFFSTMESKNPAEGLVKMASTAWHILDTILVWTWYIAKLLIDAIEGLIP